jgi:hypothetical protein
MRGLPLLRAHRPRTSIAPRVGGRGATTATIDPNLDKELTADPASAMRESTVDPNKEIATGYSANIMPKTTAPR